MVEMRYYLRKYKKPITYVVVILFFGLLIFAGINTKSIDHTVYKEYVYAGNAFGTGIKKSIYAKNSGDTEDLNRKIDAELRNLDNQLSIRKTDSEVCKISYNYSAGGKYFLSSNICQYLKDELEIYKDSDGAFNPCITKLTGLWGIEDGKTKIPGKKKIKKALEQCNGDNLKVYKDYIVLEDEGMAIDFGATGKGIACDATRAILEKYDVKGAVISIGGSICVYGDKGDGEDWNIGIQNPRGKDGETIGIVQVDGTKTVSTSGDYEKYFESDGKRYHHIIDPRTGYPADNELMSVTIICENGLQSDGMSTACFVLGLDKGMKYANKKDVEAIFVTKDKKVYTTKGLQKKLRITDNKYSWEKYEK